MADSIRDELQAAINDAKHPLSCSIWKSGRMTCSCGNEADAVLSSSVVARIRAEAWDEGHTHRQRRDPNDGCRCGAWSATECGCGKYGTGRLLSLDDNPYREATDG